MVLLYKRIVTIIVFVLLVSSCGMETEEKERVAIDTLGYQERQAIGPGGRPVGESWSRSPVYAQHGMAATAQPLASQIAIDILKIGGSAVDAAIAANAALGLMEPTGNGIGGDLFAMLWDPSAEELVGLNGSGRSPKTRSFEQLLSQLNGADTIPPLGHLPVTVPGTVDGWFELHNRYGKLDMSQVLAPAIQYAREGFPISPVIGFYFQRAQRSFESRVDQINEFENARATYFSPRAPKVGDIFKNYDLGNTLEILAEEGRDAFYKGKIAKTIDRYMRRIGGDLTYSDLATHTSEWVDPVCVDYREVQLCELPPNGQGFAALQMVSILNNVNLAQWRRDDAKVWHLMGIRKKRRISGRI